MSEKLSIKLQEIFDKLYRKLKESEKNISELLREGEKLKGDLGALYDVLKIFLDENREILKNQEEKQKKELENKLEAFELLLNTYINYFEEKVEKIRKTSGEEIKKLFEEIEKTKKAIEKLKNVVKEIGIIGMAPPTNVKADYISAGEFGGRSVGGEYVFPSNSSLTIAGNLKITSGNFGAGKVLTSDEYGNATWQTPTGGINGSILPNQIAFGIASNTIGGDNNLTWDNVAKKLTTSALKIGTLEGVLKATAGDILGGATTSDLPEGTNLYYTDARARNAISANTPITYNSATGVIGLSTPLDVSYGGTGLSVLGTANQLLGVNSEATALEYKTLQGTANQINVTHSDSTITLSTPQDIATTSSPTFSGLTLSSLIPGSILFAGSGGLISQDNTNLFWNNTTKRLGIGTNNPLYDVHIEGKNVVFSSTSTKTFSLRNYRLEFIENGSYMMGASGGGISTELMPNSFFRIRQFGNSIPIFYVGYNENVGLGTSSPTSLLELYKTNVSPILTITSATSATYSPQIQFRTGTTPTVKYTIGVNISDDKLKLVSGSDISTSTGITIDSSGNVGIGTTAPGYKLDVAGDVHGTSFPVSSDIRFKTNIQKVENVLDKLGNIQAIYFDWNELYQKLGRSDGRRQIGLIAQEVEKYFPELVSEWEQDGVKYKAVDYSRFTAVLLEAIKEQQKQINELKAKLTSLK